MSDTIILGPDDARPAQAERRPFEQWAVEKKTPDWLLEGTRLSMGWAIGREVYEADFDAAVDRAAHAKFSPNA
jgi:hypothetical protein